MKGLCYLIIAVLVLQCIALEDQAQYCRAEGNCDSFARCCARHCQGAHDSSCSEDDGRVAATSCYCQGNEQDGEQSIGLADLSHEPSRGTGTGDGIPTLSRQESASSRREGSVSRGSTIGDRQGSVGIGRQDSAGGSTSRQDSLSRGGSINREFGTTISSVRGSGFGTVGDHSSICKTRSQTCTEFTECCNRECPSPLRSSCNPGELYDAVCRCPGDVNIDSDRPSSPSRSPAGSIRDPIRDSSPLGADHTSSCKITANNDCLEFKRCCSTRCERKYSSRCSGDGRGRIMSAFCRCTSNITTTIGRGGSLASRPGEHSDSLPRRDTVGGFHDHTQTCKDLAIGGSCDSFRTCCNNRCRSSRDQNQSCTSRDGTITLARCTCSG